MASRLDFSQRRDRAEEAESLLGHRVFGEAVNQLKQDILQRIESEPIGSPHLSVLHMKLKPVDEVAGMLRAFVADYRLRPKE